MSEKPTLNLRQVKRPIKRCNGVLGPGHREETIGYETIVQQQWVIRSSYSEDSLPGQIVRHEWRDLPIVWTEKPQARTL